MSIRLVTLFTLLVLSPLNVGADQSIVIGVEKSIHSEVLEEERELRIYLPPDYETTQVAYPVLYVLDGQYNFHHTTGTLATLAEIGVIPHLIVVGIVQSARAAELSPPPLAAEGAEPESPRDEPTGTKFLRFLSEELIPHIDDEYRAAPFRVLVGHSLGGKFALHAFLTHPDLFSATVALSPTPFRGEKRLLDRVRELFEARPTLKHRLYLAMANERGLLEDFLNLDTWLRVHGPEGLLWKTSILEEENHATARLPSTFSAARFFFSGWQPSDSTRQEGLESIDSHFESLSGDYGYQIVTPESIINGLGYQALRLQELDQAIDLFEVNVQRYPNSSNVYDSLGDAFATAGDLEKALEQYSTAYRLAEGRENDPNLTAYRRNVEATKLALAEKE